MVKCRYCGEEMTTAPGCRFTHIFLNGQRYDRICAGMSGDPCEEYMYAPDEDNATPEARCGDCGATYGHPHHLGCDNERCPRCAHQLISCRCKLGEVEGDVTW